MIIFKSKWTVYLGDILSNQCISDIRKPMYEWSSKSSQKCVLWKKYNWTSKLFCTKISITEFCFSAAFLKSDTTSGNVSLQRLWWFTFCLLLFLLTLKHFRQILMLKFHYLVGNSVRNNAQYKLNYLIRNIVGTGYNISL